MKLTPLLSILTILVFCLPTSASTEFVVPPGAADLPLGITLGPDGNLWFANESGRTIARIAPADGTITTFPVPNGIAPERIVTGPDGNLWFTDTGGDFIGKFAIATSNFTEYALTANSQPIDITVGPDGALWFTEQGSKKIGRITTSGVITEFDSGPNTFPRRIATGADGNLWFTNGGFNNVARMTTSGTVILLAIPSGADGRGITAGPDGNIWFAEHNFPALGKVTLEPSPAVSEIPISGYANDITTGPDGNLWFREGRVVKRIGMVDIASGAINEYPLAFVSNLGGITPGPDNNLWLADFNFNQIVQVSTSGTLLNKFPLDRGSGPNFITAGPDGNLWFTEFGFGIGQITPQGVITQFQVPTTGCYISGLPGSWTLGITSGPKGALWAADFCNATIDEITTGGMVTVLAQQPAPFIGFLQGIAAGPDGNLWVADSGNNTIDRFTPTNPSTVTTFPLSDFSFAFGIVAGPDGNLWFTDQGNNAIGKITTAGVIQEYPIPQTISASSAPTAITNGPDGNLWFVNNDAAGTVGRITTAGVITVFPTGLSGFAQDIVAGPDGALWIPDQPLFNFSNPQLATISISGERLQWINASYPDGYINGIAVGPDHKLWFTQIDGGRIGRISAIHGSGMTSAADTGSAFSGAVASFVDGTPTAVASDFTATINWGDGASSAGTVSGQTGGPFQVSGNHAYAAPGGYQLSITFHDNVDDEDYPAQGQASVTFAIAPTATALSSSLNPAQVGVSVTFTATVTSPGATASGTVRFSDFGADIGSAAVNASGVAALSISTLAAGPHSIAAAYEGDAVHAPSKSNAVDEIVETAGQAATTTSLTASGMRAQGPLRALRVTLTATVTSGATGNVSFYDGDRLLGIGTLSSGKAMLVSAELSIGANALRAAYEGDSNFAASISPTVVVYRSPKPH